MTVFTASWSGLSCDHSQLLLYVCSLAFSKPMQGKLGETALITASAHGHLSSSFIHRGASVNFQRKVRVLYRLAGKFGRELKFELADWWSAFTSDKIKSTKIKFCYSHSIIMIIIIHYGDPVATVNQIYKLHSIKFFSKTIFGQPPTANISCMLCSVYTFDMVIQA